MKKVFFIMQALAMTAEFQHNRNQMHAKGQVEA